jgi:hypothetical protein
VISAFFAVGCALALAFGMMMYERATDHATALTHCINGGSFTVAPADSPSGRGRVVHCAAVDTHEGVK